MKPLWSEFSILFCRVKFNTSLQRIATQVPFSLSGMFGDLLLRYVAVRYDREFGGSADDTGSRALDAWTWLSVQLSDNTEFSLFHIFDKDQRTEKEKVAIFTDGNHREVVTDFEVQSRQPWTSLSSFLTYPTELYISVPSLALQLTVKAAFKHQEFNTVLVSGGGFWEGRVEVTGHRNGTTVHGPGFVELKNFTPYKDTKGTHFSEIINQFCQNLSNLFCLLRVHVDVLVS